MNAFVLNESDTGYVSEFKYIQEGLKMVHIPKTLMNMIS